MSTHPAPAMPVVDNTVGDNDTINLPLGTYMNQIYQMGALYVSALYVKYHCPVRRETDQLLSCRLGTVYVHACRLCSYLHQIEVSGVHPLCKPMSTTMFVIASHWSSCMHIMNAFLQEYRRDAWYLKLLVSYRALNPAISLSDANDTRLEPSRY